MAVDTVKKRASVLGIVWPDANGIDQADRQTILGIYGGVLAVESLSISDSFGVSRIVDIDRIGFPVIDDVFGVGTPTVGRVARIGTPTIKGK